MKIIIDTHFSSREEVEELKDFLSKNCWSFKIEGSNHEEKPLYTLSENAINDISINEKIRDEELFEYKIIDRKDFISDLIGWISEADRARRGDVELMKEDLDMLMGVKDNYIFSSISTNDYIYEGCSDFNKTCEDLLELNKSLSKRKKASKKKK